MANDEQSGSVAWIKGAEYSYTITRTSDGELPLVTNHDKEYRDNSIKLVVRRNDGSVFFEKKFTKDNFAPVLPKTLHPWLLGRWTRGRAVPTPHGTFRKWWSKNRK